MSEDSYSWLSKIEVENIHCIDTNTGKRLPPEEAVRYLDYPY